MSKAEELFHKLAKNIPDAKEGKMFGALCLKILSGKAVAMFWNDSMIFKLDGRAEKEALNLNGANIGTHLYDSPKQMKGWVQIPFQHAAQWKRFAELAIKNVNKNLITK